MCFLAKKKILPCVDLHMQIVVRLFDLKSLCLNVSIYNQNRFFLGDVLCFESRDFFFPNPSLAIASLLIRGYPLKLKL